MSLLPYLESVAEKRNLTAEQAREAMHVILGGHSSEPQLAAFLMAMRMKGETVDELVGFARAMREMAAPVDHGIVGQTLLDTCGTGGDCAGTFNISTVAAFVVAGAGVHVAKHGNRSVSNRGGAAAPTCSSRWGSTSIFRRPNRRARFAKWGSVFCSRRTCTRP
jgi:anthranilate phosphoribosyltransferase